MYTGCAYALRVGEQEQEEKRGRGFGDRRFGITSYRYKTCGRAWHGVGV